MSHAKKSAIGGLLIQEGLITQQQLERALIIQKNQKAYKPLGELCIELKFLTRAALNDVLNRHNKRIRLGQLLVNLGLITDEQLKQALKVQKEKGEKIGNILIKNGFVTEDTLINVLSIQLGVPKIVPDYQMIDKNLFGVVKKEFLLKNEVLPAFKEEGILTVIMANPTDKRVMVDLAHAFQCKIEPAVASSADIRRTISQHYEKDGGSATPEGDSEIGKNLVIGDQHLSPASGDNIISVFNYIVTQSIMEKASDIHIEPEEKRLRIRFRIDGILRHKTDLPLSIAPALTSRIKVLCGLDISEKRRHQDGRIAARIIDKEIDFRVSTYPSNYGESVVIRILHRQSQLIDLDALGFSPINGRLYQKALDQPSGIILATGPTGCGKTTTLYASLNHLNDGEKSIITVEDPIEYAIPGIVQGQLDSKVGHTYVDFLKAMMRQDPDVIMVGEIRDNSAAEAVIHAALTGHKVLSTFHTDDTTGALLRLMDMGIDTFLISSTVVSVVAQRLVRILCPKCRKPHVPEPHLLSFYNVRPVDLDKLTFYQPVGCDHCSGIGFNGRTAIHEFLVVNDSIRDTILARKPSSQIRMIARKRAELVCMHEDGFYKASQGITSLEEIRRVVFHNEDDQLKPRTADEIISLCEGRSLRPEGEEDPGPEKTPGDERQAPITITGSSSTESDIKDASAPGSTPAAFAGEVYRIRFETATIEAEKDQIADFFKEIQKIMGKLGKSLDSSLLGDFLEFIIYTAKRLEISLMAEFVEFFVRVKEGKLKILLETLIPQRQGASTILRSRETDLRLINFLMPPSGLGKALEAEKGSMKKRRLYRGRGSLIGLMRQEGAALSSPMSQFREGSGIRPSSNERSSNLYKKHLEELSLSAYLDEESIP